MKLVFEKSRPGHSSVILPPLDVEKTKLPEGLARKSAPHLPELSETEVSRHYTELAQEVYGVNSGFYPLGSCTMKYNPRIDEEIAALPAFAGVHPLAPQEAVSGCRKVLEEAALLLQEISGMDAMTFQPAAGAHGEFTGDHRTGFRARDQSRHGRHVRLRGDQYRLRTGRLRGP